MFSFQSQRQQPAANFWTSAVDNYLNTPPQSNSSSNHQPSNPNTETFGLDLFSQSTFPSEGVAVSQHRDITPAQPPTQQHQTQQRGALGSRAEQNGTRGRDQLTGSRVVVVSPENLISDAQHAALQHRLERLELAVGRMELALAHIRIETKTSVEHMGTRNEEVSSWIEKIKNGMEKFFKHYEKQFDEAVDMSGQWEPETSF